MFARLFLNYDKGHTFGKDQNTFKLAWVENFLTVAEVASFAGHPVCKTVSPQIYENPVTMLNLPTLALLAFTQPLQTFILLPSWVEGRWVKYIDRHYGLSCFKLKILHYFPYSGLCKWTGCDARCEEITDFIKHLQVQFILNCTCNNSAM